MHKQLPGDVRNATSFQPMTGFREDVLAGKPKVGMCCLSGSAHLIEIMGYCGLDYVMIDTEHSDGVGVAQTQALIRAADAAGIASLVRVNPKEPDAILHALDFGAIGIIAPHVKSRADAEAIVSAVKYFPEGTRGMCPHIRAARYGGWRTWDEYWPLANRQTMVVAVVEEPEGLANIEEIASTPGIDVVWLGVGDLGQAMGLGGDRNHPRIKEAVETAREAARRAGKQSMMFMSVAAGKNGVETAVAEGYRMLLWSADTHIFTEAVRELEHMTAQVFNAHATAIATE